MKLSIVIPALNEEATIGMVVKKSLSAIKKLGIAAEVVVADNSSTDNTCSISQELGARVVPVSIRGYGKTLQTGFTAAEGEYILMGDADDSYNFEEIKPFIDKLDEGYDFVMGNRYKGEKIKGAMPFLHRYLGTPVLTLLMNILFKTGIGDVNCGMRAFRRSAYQKMRCQAAGMEFATEMVIKASLLKLKIAEIPCTLYCDKRNRPPHLNTWRDGWRHLRFMLLFSPSMFFFLPGVSLFLLGLLGLSVLPLNSIYLDSHHLVTCSLILLTGAQIIEFGLAAKVFSYSKYFDHHDKTMRFIQKHFKLEKGLLCGILLILISVAILIGLLLTFKPSMLVEEALRDFRFKLGVWSLTGLLLGVQFCFTSFLLSFFYLKAK